MFFSSHESVYSNSPTVNITTITLPYQASQHKALNLTGAYYAFPVSRSSKRLQIPHDRFETLAWLENGLVQELGAEYREAADIVLERISNVFLFQYDQRIRVEQQFCTINIDEILRHKLQMKCPETPGC